MAAGQAVGFTSFRAPTASITDDAMSASSPAGVTKVRHLHTRGTDFGFDIDAAPTSKTKVVHYCASAGTVRAFRAGLEETGTATDINFDLLKYNDANPGGVSILSAVVSVTHGTSDRAMTLGTISSATTAAGDWLVIDMAVVGATGALGPWAEVEVDEPAS